MNIPEPSVTQLRAANRSLAAQLTAAAVNFERLRQQALSNVAVILSQQQVPNVIQTPVHCLEDGCDGHYALDPEGRPHYVVCAPPEPSCDHEHYCPSESHRNHGDEVLFTDCMGNPRCLECDGYCPYCHDGPEPPDVPMATLQAMSEWLGIDYGIPDDADYNAAVVAYLHDRDPERARLLRLKGIVACLGGEGDGAERDCFAPDCPGVIRLDRSGNGACSHAGCAINAMMVPA